MTFEDHREVVGIATVTKIVGADPAATEMIIEEGVATMTTSDVAMAVVAVVTEKRAMAHVTLTDMKVEERKATEHHVVSDVVVEVAEATTGAKSVRKEVMVHRLHAMKHPVNMAAVVVVTMNASTVTVPDKRGQINCQSTGLEPQQRTVTAERSYSIVCH